MTNIPNLHSTSCSRKPSVCGKVLYLIATVGCLLLALSPAHAQKQSVYTTSNGLQIKTGDTLMLGVGSAYDGYFNYIYSGLAATIFAALAYEYDQDLRLPEFFQGAPVVIKRIRSAKKTKNDNGQPTTWLYFDTDGWGTFMIDIESAISVCEVAWCRPDGFLSQEEFEKLILLYRSLQNESITKEKFDALRKEMLY
jgi:hypothetical protein